MPAPENGLPEVMPALLLVLLLDDEDTLLDELDVLPPVPVPALELDDEIEELLDDTGGTTTVPELELDEAALLLDEDLLEDEELVGALEAEDDERLDDEDALLDDEDEATLDDAAEDDETDDEAADDEDLLEDEELAGTLEEAAEEDTLDEEDALLDEALDALDELEAVRSPQKPAEVMLLFAAMALFQDSGEIDTVLPDWLQVAFHSWLSLPSGSSKLPLQSVTAVEPLLVTVMIPQKPVPQSLLSVYDTWIWPEADELLEEALLELLDAALLELDEALLADDEDLLLDELLRLELELAALELELVLPFTVMSRLSRVSLFWSSVVQSSSSKPLVSPLFGFQDQ